MPEAPSNSESQSYWAPAKRNEKDISPDKLRVSVATRAIFQDSIRPNFGVLRPNRPILNSDLTDPLLAIATLRCRGVRDVPSTRPTRLGFSGTPGAQRLGSSVSPQEQPGDHRGELMGIEMPKDKNKSEAAASEHDVVEGQADHNMASDAMDRLVSAIESQIVAADERHSDVLSDMQRRLGSLSGDVDDIRQRIPEDLTGDLHRIETGLETLSERVARITSADVESDMSGLEQELTAVEDSVEPESFKDDALENETYAFETPDAAIDDDDVQVVVDAPAALKSASPMGETTDTFSEDTKTNLTHGVDTFDMVENSIPGDPGSPWDDESAEELTKLYETTADSDPHEEAQVMPARTPDPELDYVAPSTEEAPESYAAGAAADTVASIDRDWLDHKFSEIAERIELTLSELDPQKTSAELGERIQSFEDRLETALQDVATREDVDGLRTLESHVTGMAAQMEHTETQMQRLESIEGTLHEVVARFTEGSGAAQLADMEGMSAAGVDPNQVAEVAAAKIADHLAMSGQGGDASDISGVRDMIQGFLNEHREGNEQTALMLDTIQQAMIRILDRLDALETAGGVPGPVAQSDVGHYEPSTETEFDAPQSENMALASQGWVDPATGGVGSDDDINLTASTAHQQPLENEVAVEGHPSANELAAQEADQTQAPTEHLAGSSVAAAAGGQALSGSDALQTAAPAEAPGQPSPDLLSDRMDSVVVPTEAGATSRQAIDKIRHNFIADAQQAKAKAAQAAVAAQIEEPAKPARRSVLAGMKSKGKSDEAGGGPFGTKTRRLLVGALLAVMVIQGAIFLMPRSNDGASDVSTPATVSDPGGEATTKDRNPAAEKSSFVVPSDGFTPAVSSDVVMNDLRAAAIDAEDRASGSVDLPFGLVLAQSTAKEWTKEGRPIFGQNATNTTVTQVAVTPDQTVTGGKVYSVQSTGIAAQRNKMPPITVGPTSLRLAAAKGDPSAQFEVATRLSEGKGTSQDFKEAATWFKRSAGQGFAQAQYRLGTLYERGLGVPRDVSRAQVWYLRAAEQGNIRAMHNLAVLSAGQASGQPDYARAAQWFQKAAESGLADSQFNAGVLYENGLGVSKDLVQAYKWYTLAARTGDKASLKRSQDLRAKLPIDVLGQAETAVRGFAPAPVNPLVNNARLAGQDWKSRHNS